MWGEMRARRRKRNAARRPGRHVHALGLRREEFHLNAGYLGGKTRAHELFKALGCTRIRRRRGRTARRAMSVVPLPRKGSSTRPPGGGGGADDARDELGGVDGGVDVFFAHAAGLAVDVPEGAAVHELVFIVRRTGRTRRGPRKRPRFWRIQARIRGDRRRFSRPWGCRRTCAR